MLVSVIIPCFKQAGYLAQAIECALAQTYAAVETVVVDDGSPDHTPQVVAADGSRVRSIRKLNAGLSAARNTGILHSTGEFLLFLDSDDLLTTDVIAKHVETLRASPNADVIYGTYHYIDDQGRRFGPRFDPRLSHSPFHQYLLGNYFPPHGAIVRRTALANSGLFDVQRRAAEDWDMWMRLAATGAKFVRTEGVSVPYRFYGGSMSRNFETMRCEGLKVLKKAESYHQNCAECRRHLRAGRWGVRENFLTHMLGQNEWAATRDQ